MVSERGRNTWLRMDEVRWRGVAHLDAALDFFVEFTGRLHEISKVFFFASYGALK